MLLELITPLLIASAPVTVFVESTDKYSHETQVTMRTDDEGVRQLTMNGTRTYDYNGRPRDSDND